MNKGVVNNLWTFFCHRSLLCVLVRSTCLGVGTFPRRFFTFFGMHCGCVGRTKVMQWDIPELLLQTSPKLCDLVM